MKCQPLRKKSRRQRRIEILIQVPLPADFFPTELSGPETSFPILVVRRRSKKRERKTQGRPRKIREKLENKDKLRRDGDRVGMRDNGEQYEEMPSKCNQAETRNRARSRSKEKWEGSTLREVTPKIRNE